METKRPFLPGSVSKLDHQLLKNNPVTWSTRIHLALFYGLAFSIFLIVVCFIVPDDPRNYSAIYSWVVLLGIISLLAFVFWMIYLLRFNVFKRFGKWRRTDTVKTFLLYFSIILLIVSWPFIPSIVQSIRANMAYSSDELVRDINSMNTKICQLEKDSIDTRFSKDTLELRNSIKGSVIRDNDINEDVDTRNLNYYFTDTATLRDRLAAADSINKLNDSVYVIYKCPDYEFIRSHSIENSSHVKVVRSIDLFRNVLQYKQTVDIKKVQKELASLFSKYSRKHSEGRWSYNYYSDADEPTYAKRIRDKYEVYLINSSINNISDKKYRWDDTTIEVSWRIAYYIVLVLALLVIIYRHTTRKTFFLSLLSSVVLTILTGLLLATSYSYEGSFYTWIIIYFIIFSILSALIAGNRQRNGVSGIALNLLVFITPFMPLVITASYYSLLRDKYYRYGNELMSYDYLFVNEERNYFIAEITGFVLLLALLATLYQMAYRKWYALPEQ